MGKIPRRIDNIKGVIYCQDFGPLPYEDDSDREQLFALAQLFRKGVRERRIIAERRVLPQARGAKPAELKAMTVMMTHAIFNKETLKRNYNRIEILAQKFMNKGVEVINLEAKEFLKVGFLRRLFGKKP